MSRIDINIDPAEIVTPQTDEDIDEMAFSYTKAMAAHHGFDLGSDEFIDLYNLVHENYKMSSERLIYFMHMGLIATQTMLEAEHAFISIPEGLEDDAAQSYARQNVLEISKCIASALMYLYVTDPSSIPTNGEMFEYPSTDRAVRFAFMRKETE